MWCFGKRPLKWWQPLGGMNKSSLTFFNQDGGEIGTLGNEKDIGLEVGNFTNQVTPYWYWEHGLEATFLLPWLLFWGVGARGLLTRTVASYCAVSSMIFPSRGYRGMAASTPESWRRLHLAMPTPGDAYTWRRPKRSTLTFLLGAPPWWVPPYAWLWLWSTPGDGSVHKPPSLELTIVFSEKTLGIALPSTWHSDDVTFSELVTWHSLRFWHDVLSHTLIFWHVA